MVEQPPRTGVQFNVGSSLRSLLDAYRWMGMPVRRYVTFVLVPAAAFAIGSSVLIAVARPPLLVAAPIAGLGLLVVLSALLFPKLVSDRRRREIRQRFHLFLTHITVLSMTNIDRVEIFRTLADQDEYGALAEEMSHLIALIDTWNQSLDDACRVRAKRIPSPILSDFLDRLAYSVGSGQPIDDFLVSEQDSIIKQFVIRYESDLAKLDVMKELYLSLMLSTVFILVFALVLPLLLGVDPTLTVGGVVVLYAIIQTGFVYAIHQISPVDPLWFHPEESTHSPLDRVKLPLIAGTVAALTLIAAAGALGLGLLPVSPDALPLPLYVAVPLTPLLLPGAVMIFEERRIRTRDAEFPSFVRALGGVESVKQTSTSNVLKTLRKKDFGALTENIDVLYKRLNMRIDSTGAWRLFAVGTGSYLIQKFGEMYVTGRRMGGEPKRIGTVISRNLGEVLTVRDQRAQTTTTLIGVVYGLTAASTFSFFVGLEVVKLLMGIAEQMSLAESSMSFLFNPGVYDLEALKLLIFVLILVNALFSSLVIRISDRGHFVGALVHFVLLTWIGALMAVLTTQLGGLVSV